jgi:hypothetical protein
MSARDNFTSESSVQVTQQSPEARKEMRLRIFDWHRIRRDIRRLHPSWASGWFAAASLFLGLAMGAGLSMISLYNSASGSGGHPRTWIVLVHVGVTAACGAASVICAIAGTTEYLRYRRRKDDLNKELDIFESGYTWAETGERKELPTRLSGSLTVDEIRRRHELEQQTR